LTWGKDGATIVWDAVSGRLLQRFDHGGGSVTSAAPFPDGERVVTCGESGSCIVWDAESGLKLSVLAGCWAKEVEVFPAGDRVLTWGRRGFSGWPTVWDATTGKALCTLHSMDLPIITAAIFPTGDRVITGSLDSRAHIWNTSSCSMLRQLDHVDWVTGVAALGAGDIVVTTTSDGRTFTWNASSGEKLHELESFSITVTDSVFELQSFPKDGRVLTINSQSAIIWDALDGSPLHELFTDAGWIHDAAVAPGGDTLVTCSGHSVQVWDLSDGRLLQELAMDEAPRPAAPPRQRGARRAARRFTECAVAVGLGSSFDPEGFGRGLPWREHPELRRLAAS